MNVSEQPAKVGASEHAGGEEFGLAIEGAEPTADARKPVGLFYRVAVTVVSLAVTVGIIQNIDEFSKWEGYGSEQYYPSSPDGCEDYVDLDRDLNVPLPRPPGAISSPSEAAELTKAGEEFDFAPNVESHTSASEDFESRGVDVLATLSLVRDIFDHPIESFNIESGLKINIYSTTDTPDFTIDQERFGEIFESSMSSEVSLDDQHYQELLDCTKGGYGLPTSASERELDVFIMPETGYCIGSLRFIDIDKEGEGNCVSQGSVSPRINIDLLLWHLVDEEVMLLSVKDHPDVDSLTASINRILAHESTHYWFNQTDRKLQVGAEERYVKAIEETIRARDTANINDSRPAILYASD